MVLGWLDYLLDHLEFELARVNVFVRLIGEGCFSVCELVGVVGLVKNLEVVNILEFLV